MNRLALIFAACLAGLATARAASSKEILLRFTSFGLKDAGGEYVVSAGEAQTAPFAIPDNGFSAPVSAPAAEAGVPFALGKSGGTPFRSLATIILPENGKRFLVLVFPGKGDALKAVVVRADDPAFRPGHVMILNLSAETLAADLGDEKFRFAPASQTIETAKQTALNATNAKLFDGCSPRSSGQTSAFRNVSKVLMPNQAGRSQPTERMTIAMRFMLVDPNACDGSEHQRLRFF